MAHCTKKSREKRSSAISENAFVEETRKLPDEKGEVVSCGRFFSDVHKQVLLPARRGPRSQVGLSVQLNSVQNITHIFHVLGDKRWRLKDKMAIKKLCNSRSFQSQGRSLR